MKKYYIQVIDHVTGSKTPPIVVPEDEFGDFRESLALGVAHDPEFRKALLMLVQTELNGRVEFDLSPMVTVGSYLEGFKPPTQGLSSRFLDAVRRFDFFKNKRA